MPTPTYRPLATVTLNSSTSSVTFSNIPLTYSDLVLVYNSNSSTGAADLRFNGDNGANYSRVVIYGPGVTSFTQTGNTAALISAPASGQYLQTMQIMGYSSTSKYKAALERGSNSQVVFMGAHRWASNAAITSLSFTTGGTFASGSNFSVYGILA